VREPLVYSKRLFPALFPDFIEVAFGQRWSVLLKTPPPSLLIETRAKWRIPNEMRLESSEVFFRESVRIWRAARPNARLRSLTSTYNCIGLVVACRRAWVDPEDLLRVLQDDGYRRLLGEAEAQAGDVVVYRNDHGEVCHAGIVVRKNLYNPENRKDTLVVLSKWGAEGEYEHDASDVPVFCGHPSEYWTDRKEAPK
jgi:hypothetical protein